MNYSALILTLITGGIAVFFLGCAAVQAWKIAEELVQDLNKKYDR